MQFIEFDNRSISIENIVFDMNGTLANQGVITSEISELLKELSTKYQIFVVTADTYSSAKSVFAGLPLELVLLSGESTALAKAQLVAKLGADKTATLGNGQNDILMFKESALSFAVLGQEGIFAQTLLVADIVVRDIRHAMKMLLRPLAIKATTRH